MQAWAEVARYFSRDAVAHLTTLEKDGAPHSVPLWIDRHGDSDLVFFTIAGTRKDRNVTRDPRVALSITDPADAYDMATVRGAVIERIDGERGQEIIDGLARKYTGEPYPIRSGLVAFVVRPSVWSSQAYSDA